MSTPGGASLSFTQWLRWIGGHLPTAPQALASLLSLVVIALFLHTFVLQPYLIPSESMERTLLVGDFLLVNKQVYAPADSLTRNLLPYRSVERGDMIIFHPPENPQKFYVKRVVGMPGDRLHIAEGRVMVNGVFLGEPYAVFEPAPRNPYSENFPARNYTDPTVEAKWWRQMQGLISDGDLIIPQGNYFVLGDNRNHSFDSRFWGFVSQQQIVAKPLVIYFSLTRPSTTDVQLAKDDRLGHDRELTAWLAGFARWKRIFHVVH